MDSVKRTWRKSHTNQQVITAVLSHAGKSYSHTIEGKVMASKRLEWVKSRDKAEGFSFDEWLRIEK